MTDDVALARTTAIPAWAWAIGLFAAAVAVRALHLNDPPAQDGLYHLLAARSWASEGTLRIAEGEYTRASLYTMLLGGLFRIFGESLEVARIPSVLAGALAIVVLFFWLRSVAGGPVAWIAAGLFGLSPLALEMSNFVRFYALHGLLVLIAAVCGYAVVMGRASLGRKARLIVGSVAALAVAVHLQPSALLGLIGFGTWLVLTRIPRWIDRLGRDARARMLTVVGAIAASAAILVFARSPLGQRLIEDFFSAVPWTAADQYNYRYYHYLLLERYPTLWTLFPAAALVALARRPGPGFFCLVMFAVPLLLHSVAGMKSARYIYYLLPFFFGLWGIVLAEMVPYVRALAAAVARHAAEARLRWIGAGGLGWVGVGTISVFLVLTNPAFPQSYRMLSGGVRDRVEHYADWTSAAPILRPLVRKAAIVLTTNDLRALYYLGRYDVLISPTVLYETDRRKEFSIDRRTGRPVIGTAASLRKLLACYATGLFVSDGHRWRQPALGIADRAADVLAGAAERIALPESWNLRVYMWSHEVTARPADCKAVVRMVGARERHPK